MIAGVLPLEPPAVQPLAPPVPAQAQGPVQSTGRSLAELRSTLSASRLGCWQQCRLKFYFRYVLNLRKRITPALFVGKVAHAILQQWNMARWKREPFQIERYHTLFQADWVARQANSTVNWDGEEQAERETAWSTLETYFAETPIKADERPEAVEVPMEAELPGLPNLVGILDLVRSGGTIVDFKTAGQTPTPDKVIHLHEAQLTFYGLLYRDATGKREAGFELHHLVKLKTPKLIVTPIGPVTRTQEARLYRSIESYLDGLDRRDFVPSPGLQCSACEFYNECRRWNGKEDSWK